MKKKIDIIMKNYYEQEVSAKKVPHIPVFKSTIRSETRKKGSKLPWDNMFLTACIISCFTVIILPSTYDNTIRKLYVPISKYEAFKKELPRIIFDASLYFKRDSYLDTKLMCPEKAKKGVYND